MTAVGTVAVLSDVHGVLPALDAVLAEPAVRAADLVVITGDHAAGPQPVPVLERLRALGDRVVLVRGNADRELVSLARGEPVEAPPESVWAAAQLGPADVELLAGLPHPVVLDVASFGPTAFCHGSVRDDDEVVLVDTRMERWLEVLADLPAEVATVVCGHTHMPFLRLVAGRLVVNPGSVGMPYGRPGAHWALFADGAVALRRTLFDVEAAGRAIVATSGYPGAADWVDEYVRGCAGDDEALAVFAPRDGRGHGAGGG